MIHDRNGYKSCLWPSLDNIHRSMIRWSNSENGRTCRTISIGRCIRAEPETFVDFSSSKTTTICPQTFDFPKLCHSTDPFVPIFPSKPNPFHWSLPFLCCTYNNQGMANVCACVQTCWGWVCRLNTKMEHREHAPSPCRHCATHTRLFGQKPGLFRGTSCYVYQIKDSRDMVRMLLTFFFFFFSRFSLGNLTLESAGVWLEKRARCVA